MQDFMEKGGGWVVAQGLVFVGVAVALVLDGDGGGSSALLAVGLVVALAGAALAGDGVVRIRRDISALPAPVDGAPLMVAGSFGLVRHPIYGGLTLAAAGLALARTSVWGIVAAAGLGVFFILKSRREEILLAAAYPAYGDYQRRVRHRLIPWLI